MTPFDLAWHIVGPTATVALTVALLVDVLVWTVGGVALWRHRARLSRRQWIILGGSLAVMVVVRVVVAAWL